MTIYNEETDGTQIQTERDTCVSQFKAWKCEDSLRDMISAIKVALTIQEIEKHDRSRIGEFMDAVSKAADGDGFSCSGLWVIGLCD